MKSRMEVIARGVCLHDGHILLCKSKGANHTFLPGGHVEFMELARTGLEREIVEELSAESTAGAFLGIVEHCFMQNGKRHCEWNVVFALSISGITSESGPESSEAHISFEWCALDALKEARLEPEVLCELLPQWLGNAFGGDRWASGGDFA